MSNPTQPKTAFDLYKKHFLNTNKRKRYDANGHRIFFLMSFEQWQKIWQESGHWNERGTHKGQYVMSRKNDIGHYVEGNVEIILHSQNVSDASKAYSKRKVTCPTCNTTGSGLTMQRWHFGHCRMDASDD